MRNLLRFIAPAFAMLALSVSAAQWQQYPVVSAPGLSDTFLIGTTTTNEQITAANYATWVLNRNTSGVYFVNSFAPGQFLVVVGTNANGAMLIMATNSSGVGLQPANNLNDVANSGTSRANIGADNASNLTLGTLGQARLPGMVVTNNGNFAAGLLKKGAGVNEATNATPDTDYLTPSGSAASLTALNASQLTSGTVPQARLTSDVVTNNGSFATGLLKKGAGANEATNATPDVDFLTPSGSAASLTALNASQLTSGTIPQGRLTSDVVTNNGSFSAGLMKKGAGANEITNATAGTDYLNSSSALNGANLTGGSVSSNSFDPGTLAQLFSIGGGTTIHSIYDVKNYSAVGNGSTDDTAAFTNAVYAASQAGGGIVWIPQGHFKLTATILVSNAPIWFVGAGAGSKIEPSGNFDVFRFYGNTRGSGAARFFVSGTNQTGGNIFTVTNAHRITFKDITLEAPWQVFSIESCNTCTIDNLWADGVAGSWFCKWFGDDANRSDVLQMNNVTASGGTTNTDGIIWDGNCNSMDLQNVGLVTMNYGIHILKSAGANAPAFLFSHGLQIDFPNREAVKIEAGQRFNFSDSYMHGSTLEYGVFATNGVDQVTIQGGNITGHKKGGIHLQSTGSKVIGVEIYNNSQAGTGTYPGILVTNGAICSIVGNRISSNHSYGLRIESSTRPVMVGNDMSGNVSGEFFNAGNTLITENEMTQRPFFTETNTYVSGRASAISTLVVSANKLYMLPIWVTEIRQFNLMTLGFVSSGTVGFCHMGIYGADRTTGHPTTLILDAHEVVTTTTGTKITNAVVTLNPGMYHLACEFSAAPTVHAILSDSLGVLMNNGVSDVGGLSRTFSYGALPADESAQTYSVETTFMPAVGIR